MLPGVNYFVSEQHHAGQRLAFLRMRTKKLLMLADVSYSVNEERRGS